MINWIEYSHAFALALLLLARMLSVLTMFKPLRYLFHIIKSVIYDMKDFLVITFLCIIVFTIVYNRFTFVVTNYQDEIHINENEDHGGADDDHSDGFFKNFKASFNIAILADYTHIQLIDFFS
jgi:hypothetical protein